MAKFTEAKLKFMYSELKQAAIEAAFDHGGEMTDGLSLEIAAGFMDDYPEAVEYLEKVKGIADVQRHLADEII